MTERLTPEQYEQKRDDLAALLDDATMHIQGIPVLRDNRDKTLDDLRAIRRRIAENQFTIALLAAFQGGKSTTFDALCDGAEISPRGVNIKTSATVISAQHTADADNAGQATIIWRSDRELALNFVDLVGMYLRHDNPDRFTAERDLADVLDLRKDMPAIERALAKEWEVYRRDPARYDLDNLDALRIGTIICRHVGSPDIAALKERNSFKLEEVGELVRFPERWEPRWCGGNGEDFTPRECAFAFIKEAKCKVSSPNLARTGSVIVDCPGLFASKYDTGVAIEVLSRADAVWFLCGDKALSASELKMIRKTLDIHPYPPFFTINMRGSPRANILENLRPANVAFLRAQAGVEIGDEEMLPYHALLALCAAQGRKIVNGRLDRHSESALLAMYKKMNQEDAASLADAWEETVADQLQVLKVPERREFSGLNAEGIALARAVSGIDGIVSAIEAEVIAKKAESILYHNGARKIDNALRAFEGELAANEEDAKSTVDKAMAIYDSMEAAVKTFQTFVEEEIANANFHDDIIETALADDYWKSVFIQAVAPASNRAADAILKMDLRYWILNPSQEDMKAAILEAYEDEVRERHIGWNNRVAAGENRVFNKLVTDQISHVAKRAAERWHELSAGLARLEAVPEILVSDDYAVAGTITVGSLGDVDVWRQSFWTSIEQTLVQSPLIQAVFGWFGWGGDASTNAGATPKTKTAANIEKALSQAILSEQDKRQKELKKHLSAYRTSFAESVTKSCEAQNERLHNLREQALSSFEAEERVRTELARQYQEARETHMEPLRKRVQEFITALASFFPDAVQKDSR